MIYPGSKKILFPIDLLLLGIFGTTTVLSISDMSLGMYLLLDKFSASNPWTSYHVWINILLGTALLIMSIALSYYTSKLSNLYTEIMRTAWTKRVKDHNERLGICVLYILFSSLFTGVNPGYEATSQLAWFIMCLLYFIFIIVLRLLVCFAALHYTKEIGVIVHKLV